MNEISGGKPTNGTASALIKTGSGKVWGIIINSHSSGTFKFWDALTATGTVVTDTFTLSAGSQVIKFPEPLEFQTGLYLTIGGTMNYTVVTK